jgi:hypothetical protein
MKLPMASKNRRLAKKIPMASSLPVKVISNSRIRITCPMMAVKPVRIILRAGTLLANFMANHGLDCFQVSASLS